jgi:hypothetical protein
MQLHENPKRRRRKIFACKAALQNSAAVIPGLALRAILE